MRKLIIGLTEKTGLNISVSPGQIIAAALVVVLVGVAGGAYWFGGKSDHEPALVLNTMPASSDGIQVHGHWTMTVTNPDGTVEALHEFDNSLQPSMGASFLTALLAGQTSMTRPLSDAPYRIGVNRLSPPGTINGDWYCEEYVETGSTSNPATEDAIVKAAMVRADSLGNPLELSGICTVTGIPDTETASVVDVNTQFKPSNGINFYVAFIEGNTLYQVPWLTHHALDAPIAVKNRQVIGLNVIISFD